MPSKACFTAVVAMGLLASPALADKPAKRPASAAQAAIAGAGYLSATEREAVAFRKLQTELMVAALACKGGDHRASYNAFVVRFRPTLKANANILKRVFTRAYGKRAKRKLDDFMTALANEASMQSITRGRYCQTAGQRLATLLRANPNVPAAGLLQLAERAGTF